MLQLLLVEFFLEFSLNFLLKKRDDLPQCLHLVLVLLLLHQLHQERNQSLSILPQKDILGSQLQLLPLRAKVEAGAKYVQITTFNLHYHELRKNIVNSMIIFALALTWLPWTWDRRIMSSFPTASKCCSGWTFLIDLRTIPILKIDSFGMNLFIQSYNSHGLVAT